jgi:hypothetical protein
LTGRIDIKGLQFYQSQNGFFGVFKNFAVDGGRRQKTKA